MTSFHILYADINSFIASQVKMRLEWEGYQVTSIDNEQELISNLHKQSYDLLIVDFLTPKPNAFSLFEGFKKNSTIVPTIIVSNKIDKDCRLVTKAMQ